MDLKELQRACARLEQQRVHALSSLVEEESRLLLASEAVRSSETALAVLQSVAETVQRLTHDRLAGVVSRCLRAIFGDLAYGFEIDFSKKRGRTEARMFLTRDGKEFDPLSSAGGGVVDVASLALRVACLSMAKPPLRKLLVLDEPLRFLDKDRRQAARELLETLAKETGLQIVMVTHDEEFQIGKVVRL